MAADKNPLDGVEATLTLTIDGGTMTIPLKARTFKTGSLGFQGQGKVEGKHGRFQCNLNAVLIGSKPDAA